MSTRPIFKEKFNSKKYYLKNRDRLLKYSKNYNKTHKRKEYSEEYYLKNRVKLLLNMKKYYETHKEERKKYILKNREKINRQARTSSKLRRLALKVVQCQCQLT